MKQPLFSVWRNPNVFYLNGILLYYVKVQYNLQKLCLQEIISCLYCIKVPEDARPLSELLSRKLFALYCQMVVAPESCIAS
jgi:hypothetical protein